MGLFKKLFSIGSRKFKKRSAAHSRTESESLPPQPSQAVDDTETAVNRLLRSSSRRYAIESQNDLNFLPHLPHPIDSVIPLPKSSSTTIASVSARSTYSVTVRSRTVHSRTEFPNAYPPMDSTLTPKRSLGRCRSQSVPITPRDKSRIMLLRQDPSVASLLNHYDEQGHLNSALFSNTPSPQREGGVQRRRTGSTLRQLLGHPSSAFRNTSMEGDISWAERFLGETDANSSRSSLGPRTPVDTHFIHTLSIDDNTALSIECDTSAANQRTFSSLEVELSASADLAHQALDSLYGKSTTPQRASQIFDFLGDKKRACDGPVSKLPQLKTTSTPQYRRFSADSSISDTKQSRIPIPRHSNIYIPQPASPVSERRFSVSSDASRSPPPSPMATVFLSPQPDDEEPASSQAIISQHTGQSNRGPRGPRPSSRIPSRQSTRPSATDDSYPVTEPSLCLQTVSGDKPNIDNKYTGDPRPREMHSQIPKLRSASGSSSSSGESRHNPIHFSPCPHPVSLQPGFRIQPKPAEAGDIDTQSRLPQPITPIRSFGLHAHHLRELPSPASSSELSPVAKQMMANLRQQRIQARQRERQAGRLGSSQNKIRN